MTHARSLAACEGGDSPKTESDFVTKQQEQKIVQYVNEAHGAELALVRQLQGQIAMTPRGQYRDGLETHLEETRRHAERLERRLGELGQGNNPLQVGLGALESLVGQALALTKTPLDLVRGTGGEEKVLKNAKDSCAAEALEIATYTALARLARSAGDTKTERLANSVRRDEQRMLDRLLKEIPRLTDAVARAEFDGAGSYDVTETGAADTMRDVGGKAKRTTRKGAGQAKRTAREARKVPGVAPAEGAVKGAVASESDLAIANYDSLSGDEVQDKLSELSQIDLAKVDAYERKNQNRSTITGRIDSLRASEPWPGYDELGVEEIRAVLDEADDSRIEAVRGYERRHKNRAGVLQATERELSNA
jgi:ferritin-like metal-binding protein YciE